MAAVNPISRGVNGLVDWVNERAPSMKTAYEKHLSQYYAPKNFNFWYYFGSRHRHLPDHALQAQCDRGLRFGRIHHA
jgi:hypothetical protein